MLEGANAVIYGGGGAIGGAVARKFAERGARIFVAGRDPRPIDAVVEQITRAGGRAEAARVDALDERSVHEHIGAVVEAAGSVDITLNAIGVDHLQGVPLVDMAAADYLLPITTYATTNFLTATAAARHMIKQGSGVILTLSTPGALVADGVAGGFGVACAAVEGLSRQLAGELGPHGIRVVCLRPDGIPEAAEAGSHSRHVFGRRAQLAGVPLGEFLDGFHEGSLLHRAPTLDDVANVAAFMASEQARAMTATIANISSGSVVG